MRPGGHLERVPVRHVGSPALAGIDPAGVPGFFRHGRPSHDAIRRAAAQVAHVLHTPMTALMDAEVEDLMEWAEDVAALWKEIYGRARP